MHVGMFVVSERWKHSAANPQIGREKSRSPFISVLQTDVMPKRPVYHLTPPPN